MYRSTMATVTTTGIAVTATHLATRCAKYFPTIITAAAITILPIATLPQAAPTILLLPVVARLLPEVVAAVVVVAAEADLPAKIC
jgi:hypothetical protein